MGEVAHVVADPIVLEISHIVVRGNGTLRLVSIGLVGVVDEKTVELRCNAAQLTEYPAFSREDYLSSKEVEIPHLEQCIQVEPGEVLVPFPELERSVARRTFYTGFVTMLGGLIALPLVWPVLRFIIKPMYAPFDERWVPIGNIQKIKQEDVGVQFRFKKMVKDSVLEREDEKNEWVVKASPRTLAKVYAHGPKTFVDEKGNVVWVNSPVVPYVAFSGKCPHLGCGFKWRTHKTLGQVFLCPCHLSIYDASGTVLDGPAPRPLDVLPIRISPSGDIEVIDIEYKAGRREEIRIA